MSQHVGESKIKKTNNLETVIHKHDHLCAFNQMYGKTGHHNHAHVEFPECAGHTCPFRVLCDPIPGHAGASTPDLGATLGARAHTKTS